jgi:ABC-type uncharacterized transport system ATPase subunit
VMHIGKLVTQGTIGELRASSTPRARVETADPGEAAVTFGRLGLAEVDVSGGAVTGLLDGVPPERIVAALVRDGVPVRSFNVVAPTLEELFVSLTGEGFDVSG